MRTKAVALFQQDLNMVNQYLDLKWGCEFAALYVYHCSPGGAKRSNRVNPSADASHMTPSASKHRL
jgi:hypothetical protein